MNWQRYLIIGLLLSLSACQSIVSETPTAKSSAKPTLYQELGGSNGIEGLVDEFIKNIGQDKTILKYFAKSSVSHFRQGFISHLCHVSDGPCEYKGDSMVDIHTGMNINETDFNRVVELLVKSMESRDISYPVQNKVLARLAPMRSEVINI